MPLQAWCCSGQPEELDWWAAWAALAVWLAWFVAIDIILFRGSPGLAAERSKPPAGAMKWDKLLLSLMRLVQLARYLLAGLDQRYGWTGGFALPLQVAALVTSVSGQALVAWAMAANPFFSQVVRIQKERGHAVIRTGPYRVVRHPAYTGLILFELSVSALLASWAALIAGGAVCAAARPAHRPRRPHPAGRAGGVCGLRPGRAPAPAPGHLVASGRRPRRRVA